MSPCPRCHVFLTYGWKHQIKDKISPIKVSYVSLLFADTETHANTFKKKKRKSNVILKELHAKCIQNKYSGVTY